MCQNVKRCQVVKKMSNLCQKIKHLDYGGGSPLKLKFETKPRTEIVQNAEEAFQMGRKMMTEHNSIVAQAFDGESPDIPNATLAEGQGSTGGKETPAQSKAQPGQPVTATITKGKEQHTVYFNFTNKEQHRENSLQDVQ